MQQGTKKIAYSTTRLNKNLENVMADGAKKRKWSERSLKSALLVLQYSSSRFSDYRILCSDFLEQAYFAQMIDCNCSKAKEFLYLCALCQKFACLYFDPHTQRSDGPWEVDLHQLGKFEAAVIADADDLALELGSLLLNVAGSVIHPFQISRGEALYHLFAGNHSEVERAAHALKGGSFPRFTQKANEAAWRLGQACEDILNGNEQRVNDYLADQLRRERRSYTVGDFLNIDLLALSKIAAKKGLKVTLNTIDCPQELIIPEVMDYRSVDIPVPKEGFPWDIT